MAADRRYRWRNRWRTTTRQEVLNRDGHRCRYIDPTTGRRCTDRGDDGQGRGLTLAHLVPKRRGGTDDPTNLVTLCRRHHGHVDGARRYR